MKGWIKELFIALLICTMASVAMTTGSLYWVSKAEAAELCIDECMATCYERDDITLHGLVKNVRMQGDVLYMENAVRDGWFKLTNPTCRFEQTHYAFPRREVN